MTNSIADICVHRLQNKVLTNFNYGLKCPLMPAQRRGMKISKKHWYRCRRHQELSLTIKPGATIEKDLGQRILGVGLLILKFTDYNRQFRILSLKLLILGRREEND
jgi:hypothetical protein